MTTPLPISVQQQLIASAADYSAILGGQQNTIATGFQHSAIAGGCGNTINANCASILGGCGNTVNHDYAAVFGVGVTSVASCSLHANNFVAQNMPDSTMGPFPTGTLFYDIISNIVCRQP